MDTMLQRRGVRRRDINRHAACVYFLIAQYATKLARGGMARSFREAKTQAREHDDDLPAPASGT